MATLQEVMKSQGTRKEELPPWMSYAASFDEKLDPNLEEAVKHYSERVHEKSSAQNEEELHRQKELSDDISKQYQFLNPEDYEDNASRIGRIRHSSQFITILREQCKVRCWYRQHPHADKLTLVYSDCWATKRPEVACWVPNGFMPEYSIVRFDEHGVPVNEQFRGWRTCLLQMILKGIVSEKTANKYFGYAVGPASARFNSTLYEWRNRRISVWEKTEQGGE